ncbi:MAG TPA: GNAT family N-acetyltransferase [Methylophilaceae bacterium]|nr:GNAT family N-acetyltransferase [Methylophilaceae bacterium]
MQIRPNNNQIELRHAESTAEILACYSVMRELRPHLATSEEFLERVRRQAEQGYRLLAAWRGNEAWALAGYRSMEMLIHGKFIYVDDLVTREGARGKRLGQQLLAYLYGMAWEQDCSRVMLDTGIANGLAQRFYFRMGMLPTGLHFGYQV